MNKKILLFWGISILTTIVRSQTTDTVYLQDCINKALDNYQVILKSENNQKIIELQQLNYKLTYLPTLKLEAQATYQSQVLEIKSPFPQFEFPQMPYAQYKTYAEINQLLYDGGYINTNIKILETSKESNELKSQIDQKEIVFNVGKLFFYILSLQNQKDIFFEQQKTLQKNLQTIESAISNNANTPVNRDILKIEIIKVQQKIDEINILTEQIIKKLSVFSNQNYENTTKFCIGVLDTIQNTPPNLKAELIDKTIEANDLKNKLIRTSVLPQVYAFGQFGYGRPGFNMLNKDFSPFAFVGVKFTWKLWDWRTSHRNILINNINNENLNIDKNNSIIVYNSKLVEYNKQIELLEKNMFYDLQMIDIQQKIVETFKSQLENGLITSNQYIEQLNKLSSMQITFQLHNLQLIQCKFELSNLY